MPYLYGIYVDEEVIEGIKKCFARATHRNGNENQQRAASKMAHKIMKQYSISEAKLMKEEAKTAQIERGGMSTVRV